MLELDLRIIRLDDPAPWPELATTHVHHVTDTIGIAILEAGMGSGAPSIAIRLELDEDVAVIAETSLALLTSAVIAARGAFPEAFTGGPLDATLAPADHALARMRVWAAINPHADTQGLTDAEWAELAIAAVGA